METVLAIVGWSLFVGSLQYIYQQKKELSAEKARHVPWNKGKSGYKLPRKIKAHLVELKEDYFIPENF